MLIHFKGSAIRSVHVFVLVIYVRCVMHEGGGKDYTAQRLILVAKVRGYDPERLRFFQMRDLTEIPWCLLTMIYCDKMMVTAYTMYYDYGVANGSRRTKLKFKNKPPHEKTNNLSVRNQRSRSVSQKLRS